MAAGTFADSWKWIKSHPYIVAAIVFVGGAVLIYIYYSGSGTAAAATSATDPNADLLNQEAIQAQYSAALSSQQTELQAASIAAGTTTAAIAAGQSIASQSISAVSTLGLAQIGAQSTVDLASIGAGESVALGSIAASVDNSALMYGYLNNAVDQQYGFLDNLFGGANQGQVTALEGEVQTQGSQIGTLQGNIASQGLFNAAVQNSVKLPTSAYSALLPEAA